MLSISVSKFLDSLTSCKYERNRPLYGRQFTEQVLYPMTSQRVISFCLSTAHVVQTNAFPLWRMDFPVSSLTDTDIRYGNRTLLQSAHHHGNYVVTAGWHTLQTVGLTSNHIETIRILRNSATCSQVAAWNCCCGKLHCIGH